MPGSYFIIGFVCLLAGVALAVGASYLQRQLRAGRADLVEQTAQRTAQLLAEQAEQRESERLAAATEAAKIAAERDAAVARNEELAPLLLLPEGQKRYRDHWNVVNAVERLTSIVVEATTDNQVAKARMENALLLMEWIRASGNPEAPWPEIVRWANNRNEKEQPK